MFINRKYWIILLAACLLFTGCRKESIIPEGSPQPGEKVYSGLIPEKTDRLPRVYITTPHAINSKTEWTDSCLVRISVTVDGETSDIYSSDLVKIKGHGNSTWTAYPKKPYSMLLPEQANFIGTGKTKRWILLANWMDRTLLRNDVAFEAARRTCLAWTPSGTFVDVYMNGEYTGCYWLGERIHVEGSHFTCDYLYSFDTSDRKEYDFESRYGHWKNHTATGGIPVEIKYPDRSHYSAGQFKYVINRGKSALFTVEETLMRGETPSLVLDLDSFCDWYIVNELTCNKEANHPKSAFMYIKDGKLFAGPVWDFDWGTFTPDHHSLQIKSSLYYFHIWSDREFRNTLKRRWSVLKPRFETLGAYVDQRAKLISASETLNHRRWPCHPNPLASDDDGMVNGDELMTFNDAVKRLKQSIEQRIEVLDAEINRL